MAIAPLFKMTLFGAEAQKESVIDGLQQSGCAHLIDLVEGVAEDMVSDASQDARRALRFLQTCPEQRRQVRRRQEFNRQQIVADTLNLLREKESADDEREELRSAIRELEPWGDFQLPPDAAIGQVRFWFYVVPLAQVDGLSEWHGTSYEISRDATNCFVLILSDSEPTNVPGSPAQLDPRSLTSLRERLEDVEELLEDMHHRRVGLTRWRDCLADDLDAADDAAARQRAARSTRDGKSVYALSAWVPERESERLRRFAEEHQLAITFSPPENDEDPPTLLENPESMAGSEALVTFYKTPEYRSWDPSLLSYAFFALFFAMILADAGYGIILALLTSYFWKQMGQTRSGRRNRNVLAVLVVASIAYGVACGSYFGVAPAEGSLLSHLQFIDAESQQLMMPLTIVIGVVHLSLANLMMAWTLRGRPRALAPLGWVGVMVGATLAGLGSMASLSEQLAEKLVVLGAVFLVGGLMCVFCFSSERPLWSLSWKNHLLRCVDGLRALTGVSGIFGDVLSYLRLFALGLSSAKLSQTFNSLGASAWDAAGFGVIAAIAIVILGHTLNLLLSIMGGVVHGLRLNCIEFFKWSLPEEGYQFKAFAKKARQP